MSMPLHPAEATNLGPYELLGRLGRGGMGAVYLGRSPDGRKVAIKVIRAELSDRELRARFRSEVNRLRQVPSFSTAAVLDANLDHDPAYLVVEYVDGPSLADVVRDRGPMSREQLHGVAIGITTALSAIHGAGVIHRDLKPENVLLPVGGVKVIDFGIARSLDVTSAHTSTDQMVGTVAYMAPERFASDGSNTVTPAADIFAWGVMVAYAATGRTPFAADSPPATAMKILSRPPNLTGLHQPMRDLVERALAKEPSHRPTARQLLDALLADDGRSTAAGPQATGRPAPAGRPAAVVPPQAAGRPAAAVPPQAAGRTPSVGRAGHSAAAGRATVAPARSEFAAPSLGSGTTRAPRSIERLTARTSHRRKRNALAVAGSAVALTAAVILGLALNAPVGEADSPAPRAAAQQAGGAAAADNSTNSAPAPPRPQRAATPAALLELLSRMYPGRTLARAATAEENGLWVQVLMDDGDGPGRLALLISRDKNPDSDVRTGAPKVTVQRLAGNCIQDVVVRADWSDGTHVSVDVSTCLPWNGSENPESPPPLTVAEARKLVADPRWGITMDAELVAAGAKHFPKIIKLG
jgi:eukaryotic-like serine/threonine-protein kinase